MSVIEDANTTGKEDEIGKAWPRLLRILNELLCSLIFSKKFSQGPATLKAPVKADPQKETQQGRF